MGNHKFTFPENDTKARFTGTLWDNEEKQTGFECILRLRWGWLDIRDSNDKTDLKNISLDSAKISIDSKPHSVFIDNPRDLPEKLEIAFASLKERDQWYIDLLNNAQWKIDMFYDIRKKDFLGIGSYGEVFTAIRKGDATRTELSVKQIENQVDW